jgi:ComF family protein
MLNLLFPKICNGCQNVLEGNSATLCLKCRHALPLASFHKNGNDRMKHIFYGRLVVKNATALFEFQKKGITQQIMHNLKYREQEEISYFFGRWLGAELKELPEYREIDMVIPVPLHKQKLKKRGYNQVTGFAKEIAAALDIPCRDDILLKVSKTNSQVFKKRLMRIQEEAVFSVVRSEVIKNKHILLVDDIVTTGATLETCANKLLEDTNATISLATMAIA